MSLDTKESFKAWKKDPAFKKEYDALEGEFSMAAQLIECRKQAKLTQAEIAERMGTDRRQVYRIESGSENTTLASLQRYAAALGKKLDVRLV